MECEEPNRVRRISIGTEIKGCFMNADIRVVRADELGKLLELYRHLNADDPDISAEEGTKRLWAEIMQDPGQTIFVAEKAGILIASCTLTIIKNLTRGGKPYALIENVVTHSGYRKMGYGRAVLKKAIETARENGCYKVMLMTGRKDEGTLLFYEKVGFERGMKTAYCIKFGGRPK